MLSAPVYIFRCFLHITYIWKLFSSLLWRYFYTTLGSTQFQIPFSKTHIFPPPVPLTVFSALSFLYPPSTLQFTSYPLMVEHHLTLHPLSLYFLPHLFPIAVPSIFSYIVSRAPIPFPMAGFSFLMACPLLDHTRSPWGVRSKKTEWMFIWSDISCFCTSRRWTEINCNLFRTDTVCIHLNWCCVSEMVYIIAYCLER